MRLACLLGPIGLSAAAFVGCSGANSAGLAPGSDAGGSPDTQGDVATPSDGDSGATVPEGGVPLEGSTPVIDSGSQADDAGPSDTGAAIVDGGAQDSSTPVDAGPPYRHTITIDGVNDFTTASEQVSTTSTGYDAYVTWDATSLYLGFDGSDIAAGATGGQTFLFAYIDQDPGAGTGAITGEQYGTQTPKFPNGFGAELLLVWNPGTGSLTLATYQHAMWVPVSTTTVNLVRGSSAYVEMSIPLSTLGVAPTGKLGLVTMMMYTHASAEWSYAGLWSGSFTDGYYGMVPCRSTSGAISRVPPPRTR